MAPPIDFKVERRREASEIESVALYWRQLDESEKHAKFDALRFLYSTVPRFIEGKQLIVTETDDLKVDSPAYVQHRKLDENTIRSRLYIESEVISHANMGSPEAIYIIAHECGHIILHNHNCLRLSIDPDTKLRAFDREELAEWQAHRFARALVAPISIAKFFTNPDHLSECLNISLDNAARRIEDISELRLISRKQFRSCGKCGGLEFFPHRGDRYCLEC